MYLAIVTLFLCTTQFASLTLESRLFTPCAYGFVMWLCCRQRVILWPRDPDCELYLEIRQHAGYSESCLLALSQMGIATCV